MRSQSTPCCRTCWIRTESESSPQQARIKSSSGLKILAYGPMEAVSRDGAGCGKAKVGGDCSRSSDRNFPRRTIVQTTLAFVYSLCSPGDGGRPASTTPEYPRVIVNKCLQRVSSHATSFRIMSLAHNGPWVMVKCVNHECLTSAENRAGVSFRPVQCRTN